MESSLKQEILYRLKKIETAVQRLITQNEMVKTVNDYYCTPWGMERLESSCMLLIAVGESIKGLDKDTNKQLLPLYPEVDWKGAMGLRDIIAHHYFDIDGETVLDVIKSDLPTLLKTLGVMQEDIATGKI
ncbi:MAG: DUF86 domain-containing protein [Prevotella ruminicola]|jgi:uncharacterized protein with HEPN domain|uniref:DUF86 domain-containing protein n=1 Tax=Xylanibacter ruminicola TaxID=839 RepID=A0A9D5SC58_XYLRU|nr:DUF86 domain-containing protein [Xylanibacter ruminicola]MBP3248593.1 DUF86 domain-containing protein [Prevotella sp.]